MKSQDLSAFMPAFNEKENIVDSVNSVYRYLTKNFRKYELIIVDDGSTDGTDVLVKRMMKTKPNLRLIQHPSNKGYGAALRSGFKHAKYELIFYTDADNQFAISDLSLVLPLISDCDIVAGYRIKRQDPLMRIFIANVYNLIIFLTLGLKIRDVDCSFKLYRKKVFDSISLISQTGLIDAEVLVKARKKGFLIKQVGVQHFPRINGKTMYEIGQRNQIFAFVRPQVIVDLLQEIFKLKKEL